MDKFYESVNLVFLLRRMVDFSISIKEVYKLFNVFSEIRAKNN